MIVLAFYVSIMVAAVMVPSLLIGRYLEWRAQDFDRRIARLEERRRYVTDER